MDPKTKKIITFFIAAAIYALARSKSFANEVVEEHDAADAYKDADAFMAFSEKEERLPNKDDFS